MIKKLLCLFNIHTPVIKNNRNVYHYERGKVSIMSTFYHYHCKRCDAFLKIAEEKYDVEKFKEIVVGVRKTIS